MKYIGNFIHNYLAWIIFILFIGLLVIIGSVKKDRKGRYEVWIIIRRNWGV